MIQSLTKGSDSGCIKCAAYAPFFPTPTFGSIVAVMCSKDPPFIRLRQDKPLSLWLLYALFLCKVGKRNERTEMLLLCSVFGSVLCDQCEEEER